MTHTAITRGTGFWAQTVPFEQIDVERLRAFALDTLEADREGAGIDHEEIEIAVVDEDLAEVASYTFRRGEAVTAEPYALARSGADG